MKPKNSLKSAQNKLNKTFIGAFLGVALLLTFKNIYCAHQTFGNQQLISVSPSTFTSSQYQPIRPGSTSEIAAYDFTEIDRLAKELNYSGTSVTELASLLEQHAPNELAKARIIYAWITQHISYDVSAFLDAINNNNYPEINTAKVLRDHTTICSGYSNLYHALAEAMGLQSAIVIGYAKGATPADDTRFQDVNHAWNSVSIDGAWYLLDSTFGAGTVREEKFVPEFNPYYFATTPQQFINNHYPQDQGWQLMSEVNTRQEFDNFPQVSSRFHRLGLKIASHSNYQITSDSRIDLQLAAPQNIMAIADLKLNGQDLTANAVLVNRKEEQIQVSIAPPEPGDYELTVYAKTDNDQGLYGEIIKYQIEATNSVTKLPKIYAHFHQHQASLLEPLTANLRSNWSTYFNLIVPEAIDVQVVNTDSQEWTPLNGYGSYFAGNVEVQPGKIAVVAKFPGDDQYWQLVEYQAR